MCNRGSVGYIDMGGSVHLKGFPKKGLAVLGPLWGYLFLEIINEHEYGGVQGLACRMD